MPPDYTAEPYNKWSKCPHTCAHPQGMQSRALNAKHTYKVDNETITVGQIHIHHRHIPMLKRHCTSRKAHPNCDDDPLCPGKRWLENDTTTAGDIRTLLTAEEWRRWGTGIALANATVTTSSADIPEELFQKFLVNWPAKKEKALRAREKKHNSKTPEAPVPRRDATVNILFLKPRTDRLPVQPQELHSSVRDLNPHRRI